VGSPEDLREAVDDPVDASCGMAVEIRRDEEAWAPVHGALVPWIDAGSGKIVWKPPMCRTASIAIRPMTHTRGATLRALLRC
jgi:hypothetical protein